MPRNVDPGKIKVGKGLAPEGTVEDNSLRYPERDVDPLRVHLHDPSRAHMASSIGIVDEGQFSAPFACPLPVGSVLVLDGNGANVAKHCVPSVRSDRVSITFRKIGAKMKMRAFEGPHGVQPTGGH